MSITAATVTEMAGNVSAPERHFKYLGTKIIIKKRTDIDVKKEDVYICIYIYKILTDFKCFYI